MLPQLLPQSPLEFALWGGLVIGGWVLGYFGSTFEGKWRRRFNDERRFYAQYRDETDRLNIEKTRRIAELEAQKNALSQEVVRLRGDVVAAAAPAEPQPVAAPDVPELPTENRVAATSEPAPEIEATAAPAPMADAPEPSSDAVSEPSSEATPANTDPAPEPAAALPIMAAAALPVAATAIVHPNILPHIETEPKDEVLLPVPPIVEEPRPEASAGENAVVAVADPVPPAPPFIEPDSDAPTAVIVAPEPVAEPDIEPAEPVQIDAALSALTRIRGIDATLAAGLGSLGVRQIEDIERLSAEDEKAIEIQLNLPPGQIANQQWRLQAALIGSGEDGLIGG